MIKTMIKIIIKIDIYINILFHEANNSVTSEGIIAKL